MDKRWIIADTSQNPLHNADQLSRIEVDLLYLRGISHVDDVASFLNADKGEGDPFLLKSMPAAVERIKAAIAGGETIFIYGDYDADGVTATALLVSALRRLGADAHPFIPDRFEHGYGLHRVTIDEIYHAGGRLIITVDCGIRAVEEVAHARSLGMDIIITDHHQPGAVLPEALAIVDPKQKDETYGYAGFAGVGLAYKLVQALDPEEADRYLDLVAIGSIADLAPMRGENRTLARRGLAQMMANPRPGLAALMQRARVGEGPINSSTIGFRVGPRLNAAGRLESGRLAYELLVAEGKVDAAVLADKLEDLNTQRQQITLRIVEQAAEMTAQAERLPAFILAATDDFHEGVVGLAASRLVDQYYRPAAVGAVGAKTTRASVRSIPEFNVTAALDSCKDLLVRYGGHAAAAGFTVANENVPELLARLSALVEESLDLETLTPSIPIDMLVSLNELHDDVLEFLDRLEPYGQQNPEPVFAAQGVEIKDSRTVGKDGAHLKLLLCQDGIYRDAIAFRMGDRAEHLARKVDVAFHFERNVFRGVASQQLNIVDIKNAGA